MIEHITGNDDAILAIVVRKDFEKDGITFITPNDYSQQVAYMHHPAGHVILPHIHNQIKREIFYTKEVLILKKGILRCDFYSEQKEYLKSITLSAGDIILLVSGGHGFECLEEIEMYEVKQGPYAGEDDKTRFAPHKFE